MRMISREGEFFLKKDEENAEKEKGSSNPHPPSSSGLSSWARLKDPRIVRVSRAFGGKDRHSKVCTVRGLRDRRVRLSVPTAIQLYDLQDRLGLNQPSKVVDWLLNAAKNEIDELPPLQMPSGGNLIDDHNLKSLILANNSQSTKQVEPNNPWFNHKSIGIRESLDKDYFSNHMRWDSSNLSLAQSGMHEEDVQNYNVLPFVAPSTQVLLYQPPPPPPAINSQAYFASNTGQSEATESETIRLSQNRIGRDFESWFHLSTTTPNPPHDLKEHRGGDAVQPEPNWPRL